MKKLVHDDGFDHMRGNYAEIAATRERFRKRGDKAGIQILDEIIREREALIERLKVPNMEDAT